MPEDTRTREELLAEIATLRQEISNLEITREFLSKTGQMAQVGGWEVDLATMMPIWSEEVRRIHEAPADYHPDLETAINFYAPEARPIIVEAVQKALADGTPWDLELPFITAKCNHIWVRTIGEVSFENGKPVRFFGTFQNITKRKVAELELQKAHRVASRYETLFDNSNVLSVIANFDGYFETISQNWARKFGYTEQEFLSKPFITFVHPDDVDATVSEARKLAETDIETIAFTNRYRQKDGAYRWLYWQACSDRVEQKIYAISIDITEQKETEKALLIAKIEAETANKAKSNFLSNMSHEIRTPLNAIMGMTDLTLQTPLSKKQKEYLETVASSGNTLLAVVNDILDFSRIETGKLTISPSLFALRDEFQNTIKSFQSKAKMRNLRLTSTIDSDVPDLLIGDINSIKQIITNLLGNAIKFTPTGSIHIKISAQQIHENQVSLQVSIQDSGIGIPSDKQEYIFNAFDQVDASSTRQFGGIGLGLAISKNLVELMNGDIRVESALGQGSTFTFTILLQEGPSENSP